MTLFILARRASEDMEKSMRKGDGDSKELKEIHKLLIGITHATSHIETQNEAIISENRKLREENASLEIQLKLLLQRNKEINYEVELLINQNKEMRDSLEEFQVENNRLRSELKQQNTKMRMVIETLKSENLKLKTEISDGIKMLRWTTDSSKLGKKKNKGFWKNLCPAIS